MKLRNDVEAIIHLLNNSFIGPYIFLDNGSVINKNDIEHFIVVHAVTTDQWLNEYNKSSSTITKRSYKKHEEKTEEQKYAELAADEEQREEEVTRDEQSIVLGNDDILHLIAKQRKINCPSATVLGDDNWFICPVYKNMDGLYPVAFTKLSDNKGYRLNIIGVPLFKLNPDTFTEKNLKDWELNSMFIFNRLFSNNSNNYLGLSAQTVFVHKKIDKLTYLIKKSMDRLKTTQKARIKLGNILVDEVLTYVGQEAYTQSKENIANAIKRKSGDKNKATKYDIKEVKVIDLIVEAYKKINDVSTENEKTVPIRREITFNNMLKKVVEVEEKEHEQLAREYIDSFEIDENHPIPPTIEEALEITKTLRASDYISSYITYINTSIYLNMVKSETDASNMVERLVKQHFLWKYFEGIKGVAHISAGAIISDIDFRSTVHPSGVIRYLGLDNIIESPDRKDGDTMNEDDAARVMRYLFEDYKGIQDRINKADILGIPEFKEDDEYTWSHFYNTDVIRNIDQFNLIKKIYRWPTLSNMSIDEIFKKWPDFQQLVYYVWLTVNIIDFIGKDGHCYPTIKHRARSKKDKVMCTYLDKNGNINVKYSLGYNAELKSKILQVMFDRMMQHSSPYYIKQVYEPYRARLERRFTEQGKDINAMKKIIFYMARRFTIQRFIEDLWIYTRQQMGWPTNGGTYYEAKLQGIHRHGLNPAFYNK